MANNNAVILETDRLDLRPLTVDDFSAVHSWGSNPENTRYMAWGPNTEEQTREFIETCVKNGRALPRRRYDFAVVLKETGAVIGSCGIYTDDAGDTAELGWILHIDYWKRGYGTEFCGELIRFGFEDLRLRRMYAPCAAVNYGSCRVMERNGMCREATHVKAFWARVDKEWIDKAIYVILAEDYFDTQKQRA
ncbi:MAG: GNAT family N-acetyltransferase [Candidatus Accumulibacter sp.]|jgi:RimJ/RimL family protein N-acetyltransferase|nr:GNAT family N-acetyltransferase [Accumulibacter sp.]